MKTGPREKGKTYYRVGGVDVYWFCSKEQLLLDIVDWIPEADSDGLTIHEVEMTEKEFDGLPEFEG